MSSIISIVIVGFLVIFLSIVVLYYNKFFSIKNMIENAIKALNVYFTRRHGLIPQLIEILEPFYPEDAQLFDELTNLKNSSASSATFPDKAKHELILNKRIALLLDKAQAHPSLQHNDNFLSLKQQLEDIDNRIKTILRYYNVAVNDYKSLCNGFFASFVAQTFRFNKDRFSSVEETTE